MTKLHTISGRYLNINLFSMSVNICAYFVWLASCLKAGKCSSRFMASKYFWRCSSTQSTSACLLCVLATSNLKKRSICLHTNLTFSWLNALKILTLVPTDAFERTIQLLREFYHYVRESFRLHCIGPSSQTFLPSVHSCRAVNSTRLSENSEGETRMSKSKVVRKPKYISLFIYLNVLQIFDFIDLQCSGICLFCDFQLILFRWNGCQCGPQNLILPIK